MINNEPLRPLQERLQALADFLPLLEQPRFVFGEWPENPPSNFGVITMPYYSLSETAESFVRMAYDMGWVLSDFSWPDWKRTDEAISLRDDPAALAAATPEQLARLLTVLIRQDRFGGRALAGAYSSGLLTGIVRRSAVIVGELDEGP